METKNIEKRIHKMTELSNLGEVGLYCLFSEPYLGIQSEKKIRYQEGGKRTYLDVYESDGDKKRPFMIYIHGGGWLSGSRSTRQFYCKHWVKRGFAAASIGYDYGADVAHPTHMREIFKAIEYLLDNAEKFNIDTERIVLAGESAGAYFSSMIGAVTTHRELYDKLGIVFKYRDTFKPRALIMISGIYDFVNAMNTNFKDIDLYTYAFCHKTPEELFKMKGSEEYDLISSARYFDEKFPPSFIIGSDKDKLLPESQKAFEALKKAGVKSELFVCSGLNGVHAGALSCDRGKSGKACAAETERFLNEVLDDIASKTLKAVK